MAGKETPDPSFEDALARLDRELAGLDVSDTAIARVDDRCLALLKLLRERCPDLVPINDAPAGTVARPVPLPAENAAALITTALRQAVATGATGRVPPPDAQLPATALWQEGPDALLVQVARCQVAFDDGQVVVTVPVLCDQIPDRYATVSVAFVVGTARRPAGLFAATSGHPSGPPVVVQRWGDALTALAWQALLDVVRGIASHAGRDADGAGLVPVALVAARTGLVVLPQARHPIDRVVGG